MRNILLITTDQQRFDTLHAAGNPHIRTPHLNWLLDSGIHFRRCYSDSPLCGPARATILTGLHAYNHRHLDNTSVLKTGLHGTLPGLLTRQGYQTRAVGKMHFSPERCHYGFEHMEILDDYYRFMKKNPQFGVPTDHGLGQNEMEPAISTVDETHSLTHWTVDRSIDFLETRDTTRPFFLWTSFSKPHPPWDPCLNYWKLYENAEVPPPVFGDWSAKVEDVPAGLRETMYILNGVDRFSAEFLRACKRAYYACITQIDYNLGLLFARLRELKLLENTSILFTSDHGELLGDHHLGGKTVFLEGSAHVPLIVRPADEHLRPQERGTHSDALVCLADILPTCAALAGVDVPAQPCDGIDLLGAARGGRVRETLIGECHTHHCVIEGTHKYMFSAVGASELLFNLDADPHEQRNLAASPACRDLLARLRAKLAARLSAAGHPAVRDGQLQATSQPQPIQALRGRWPGFHSRDLPNEVLH